MNRFAFVVCVVLAAVVLCGSAFAAGDFPYENVSFTSGALGFECIGEVTNNSGTSYSIAMFKLSFYDKGGKLLDVVDVMINNFATGQTKSFKGISMKPLHEAYKVKLQFENGM